MNGRHDHTTAVCVSAREKVVNRLAGEATSAGGLRFVRSEVLRSVRHYLRAESQGYHTILRLEERDVERGGA